MKRYNSRIVGSGAYLPEWVVENNYYNQTTFYSKENEVLPKVSEAITMKFQEITGIKERRCAPQEQSLADLGFYAAKQALDSSGIDKESIDYIILAHNFGEVDLQSRNIDLLPNVAARIKHLLGIQNPLCVAYDLLFGCPGWVQAYIQAHFLLSSGQFNRILVIGADTVSRKTDPHDIDGMLFSDGAGAVILERTILEEGEKNGFLTHTAVSHCGKELDYLTMGDSFNKDLDGMYIKMNGKGVFRYAVEKVPSSIKHCLDEIGCSIEDVSKFVMHQANVKMNKIIMKKLYNLYGYSDCPKDMAPITVDRFGNSSVATVPTLWSLIEKGQLEGQEIKKGDLIVFASVGAGMHANCIIYRHH